MVRQLLELRLAAHNRAHNLLALVDVDRVYIVHQRLFNLGLGFRLVALLVTGLLPLLFFSLCRSLFCFLDLLIDACLLVTVFVRAHDEIDAPHMAPQFHQLAPTD